MTDPSLFPPSLPVMSGMRRTADGREWLERLPGLVGEFRGRWELRLGAPYHGGSCSWAAPALRADGTRAVLKVTWPHREARAEGAVLRRWAGRGSALVYEHDPERYALLLERCEPGTELRAAADVPAEDRLLLGAGLLRRLWDAGTEPGGGRGGSGASDGGAGEGGTGGGGTGGGEPGASGASELPSVERLSAIARGWAARTEERVARHDWPSGVDTGPFLLGAALLRELPREGARETVLHGDFNPGNLLAAEREPWLAIDPKPVYGDPAFDPWPLIQQVDDPFAHPDPQRVLARRTALVADASGTDVSRVRAWAVARLVDFLLHHMSCGESGGAGAGLPDAAGAGLPDAAGMSEQVRTVARVAGL